MSVVAIAGAGPIGAATAHRLAQRRVAGHIVFVDAAVNAASGKALDIQQAGAIESFETSLSATGDVLAAVSADAIVVADEIEGGELVGERALAFIQRIARGGSSAPIVFAGPAQSTLLETAHQKLNIPANRLVGTAASAIVGAVRALAGVELAAGAVDLSVVGRPPSGFVIGWSAASAGGSLLTDRVPAHRLLAISRSLPSLWPPGPYAIGSATAEVVDALLGGSRRLHQAMTIADGELDVHAHAIMLPLELGRGRVLSRVVPSLSPQERTAVINGMKDPLG